MGQATYAQSITKAVTCDYALDTKLERVSRGEEVEFEPEEAEALGAFVETALTEEEAREARFEYADQYANA